MQAILVTCNILWIFHKHGISAYSAAAPKENRGLGSYESLPTFNQSRHNLVLCLSLFKDTLLIHIVGWVPLNSQPTAVSFLTQWSSSNTCTFLLEGTSQPSWINTRQYFSTMLGGHFKQQGLKKQIFKIFKEQINVKHTKYTAKKITLVYL